MTLDKIYAFAAGEIEKSTLYSKLSNIPSQNLRAFLYLKLSEGQNQGTPVRLHVSIDASVPFQPAMDFIDLTRILGIFLDNAFEEECGYKDGFLQMNVTSEPQGVSFSIMNALNPESNSIKPENRCLGHSSKKNHLGIGLSNVEMILGNYPETIHNAYQKEDVYVQNLMIR